MKEKIRKRITKQIIFIIAVLMLCNFILPNYSYAIETEGGGSLVKVISQFTCYIADAVIDYLQDMFITPQKIKVAEENYKIKYSPGVIFSGKVPAFDTNFIDPMSAIEVNKTKNYITINNITTGDIGNVFSRLKQNRIKSDGFYSINHYADSLDSEYNKIYSQYNYYNREYNGSVSFNAINYEEWYGVSTLSAVMDFMIDNLDKSNTIWIDDNTLYLMVFYTKDYMIYYDVAYSIFETKLTDEELRNFEDLAEVVDTEPEYKESTAQILQKVVATWYNALRRIALVGLLSVLVYIGIRIVLKSTSAKDKAKYKKMLKDWLIALCLLFVLHYIMNLIIIVVNNINQIIKVSSIGSEGEDILMSTVRTKIAKGSDWSSVLAFTIIYCVLTVYTVIFTVQYLKRVIYLAFLTMIAPLITLTYPLDKIKDEKAQAFDMWLKDYVFFSLLQVLHLLIYYIFLGSSLNLANEGNWIFAIVAIGFMTKAEKIMKKMFGFEKSKTLGVLTAGATGALVMNQINKIAHKPPKGGKTGGGSGESAKNNKNIRTATVNPAMNFDPESNTLQGNTNTGGTNVNSSNSNSKTSSSGNGVNSGGTSKQSTNNFATGETKKQDNRKKSNAIKTMWNAPRIKGIRKVAGKFTYKQLAGGILGTGLGITGGIIGFSAGLVEGDIGKAFTRMAAGATAGNYLAHNAVDMVDDVVKKVPETVHNIADTYREGAYGEEYANNVKFDREFRNSSDYSKLQKEFGEKNKDFDKNISQMLEAGITDSKKMKKILKNNVKHPRKYSIEKAIVYSEMADKCSDKILYDNGKFIKFCEDRNLKFSKDDLENIRKCIIDFK